MNDFVSCVANAHYITTEARERLLNEILLLEMMEETQTLKSVEKGLKKTLSWWAFFAVASGISAGIFTSVIFILTSVKS